MNDTFQPHPESSAPGSVLARARDAQNLSIIEVARHLKLTPAQIEALEAGQYDRLPGPVFVRGFLKNYAKLLRVDPAPLLRQIESQIPKAAPVAEVRLAREVPLPLEKRSRWPLFAGIAFLIVAALAVYEFGFNEQGHDRLNGTHDASVAPDTTSDASPAAAAPAPNAPTPPPAPAAQPTTPVAAAPPPAPEPALPERVAKGEFIDAQGTQASQTRAT